MISLLQHGLLDMNHASSSSSPGIARAHASLPPFIPEMQSISREYRRYLPNVRYLLLSAFGGFRTRHEEPRSFSLDWYSHSPRPRIPWEGSVSTK